MDYFLLTKHQSINENIGFSSMVLYNLLETEKHVDVLLQEYYVLRNTDDNVNLERTLLMSLAFLYSLGKVTVNNNMVMRR